MLKTVAFHCQGLQEWIEDDMHYNKYGSLLPIVAHPSNRMIQRVCIDRGRADGGCDIVPGWLTYINWEPQKGPTEPKLPALLPWMPEAEVILDGGFEARRAQRLDLGINQSQKLPSDQSLGLQMGWNCYPRSPWILKSEATMLVVLLAGYVEIRVLFGGCH